MGEDGEKTCPLCAEEMDLTDQQLKPCKCGYEICVWCWHHIMEMAEKDNTEGRCPACRNAYDKERIVGTTANCERLVSEINSERRLKSQKAKPKTSEGRKHLGSVRVIQRNLVYIIGIPSTLADEDALQRKEYFGQYGKVLKVSMSRTAGGAIQYSPNNTCSVYITYSKEEEAVRCIQSVHGFVLEDKSLRACFGTTKYCHAWLRNMPCNNPDCLYLHEVGVQEDSFSKDEIVSAFTRSRVQQITGATNNMMRRSGNVLPPPTDEFLNSSTTSSDKPIARSVPNNPPSLVKGSPPNGSLGRSVALPAASSWGLRVSNGHSLTASSACSDGFAKQNHTDAASCTDIAKNSSTSEETHVVDPNGKLRLLESSKKPIVKDCKSTTPEEEVRDAFADNWPPVSKRNNPSISKTPSDANPVELTRKAIKSAADLAGNVETDKISQSLCSGLSAMSRSSDSQFENSNVIRHVSVSNHPSSISSGNQGLQQLYDKNDRTPGSVPCTSLSSREMAVSSDAWVSDSWKQVLSGAQSEPKDVLQDFDRLSLKASEVIIGAPLYSPSSSKLLNSYGHSRQGDGTSGAGIHGYGYPTSVHTKVDETLLPPTPIESVLSNGFYEKKTSISADLGRTFDRSNLFSNVEIGKHSGSFSYDPANATKDDVQNWGESSIISDILSMDFDPWDTSLTSPHNIARFLSKSDKEHVPINSSSLKVQNNNQSRFSFARHDDFGVEGHGLEPSSSNFGHIEKYPINQGSAISGDLYLDTCRNSFPSSILEESYSFPRSNSNSSSVSRSQIAAPPGFSVPSRAPPPGFSSHERMDQSLDAASGNNYLDSSFLLRNHYQTQSTGNLGIEDVEFIDPAILAVGKGRLPNGINNPPLDMKSTYVPQLSPSGSDLRFQMLMQQSISAHQNLMYPEHIRDRFSPLADAYSSIPSMHLEQPSFTQSSLQSRNAHISNGHGWNGIQSGNDLDIAELLRSDRLGYNNHFSSYEDLKYRIPSSGDLYSRAFGM